MRNVFILFLVLSFVACSKDEFNPLKPKNGQNVELFLDHYWDVNDQRAFLLPQKQPSSMSLRDLREVDEREPGYTYKVKAKVVVSKDEIQDGPNSWFELVEIVSKEKYTDDEPFEIGLIGHDLFGSYLSVKEEEGQILYGNLLLNPTNVEVKQQLEAYIRQNEQLRDEFIESKDENKYREYQEYLRKLALRAVVTHDSENLGKGYIVHSIKPNE